MITRILLDLDDVLNCYTMPMLKHVGCDVDPMDLSAYPVEAGYDIAKACNILHPTKHWTEKGFFNAITLDAWMKIPVSPICHWLLDACHQRVGAANVSIITSSTMVPMHLAYKLEWMYRNLPSTLCRQWVMTPMKEICANPHTLLIDDCEANCDAFNAEGGTCCLVPKPWNYLRDVDVKTHIGKFIGEM
jgi:5'(3')-deoxyribonucleotidase